MGKSLAPAKALFRKGRMTAGAPAISLPLPASIPAPAPIRSDSTSDGHLASQSLVTSLFTFIPNRFAVRTPVADQKRRAIEKLASRKQLSASDRQKLEALKGDWIRHIHSCADADDEASLGRAGGAAGPTYSKNGQGASGTQAGGADGPTYGTNGTASRGPAIDAGSTDSTSPQLRLNLDDMRRAFKRNRTRSRRSYQRRGAAMLQQHVVLETIDELE